MTVKGVKGADDLVPHNDDAETSMLGAMLLSESAILSVLGVVHDDDFYSPGHQAVFSAIVSRFDARLSADPVTIAEDLDRSGMLDAVGGAAALASFAANTPAIGNARAYAEIVSSLAKRRRLIATGYEIVEMGRSAVGDIAEVIDAAEAKLFELSQQRYQSSVKSLDTLYSEGLERLNMLADNGNTITGVATGLPQLDRVLCGLQPSELITIGARPSMGKSSLGIGIAKFAADSGVPTLYFSPEMSHVQITERLLAYSAGVEGMRLRTGRLGVADWQSVANEVSLHRNSLLFVDDSPAPSLLDMHAQARRVEALLPKGCHLGLVIIDYIQLMKAPKAETRQQEVSYLVRGAREFARMMKLPVVALAQLSRNLELRADKRPTMADFRESGEFENASDVMMGIYRDEVYNPHSDQAGIVELGVLKYRNGPCCMIPVRWDAPRTRMLDLETPLSPRQDEFADI